MPKYNSNPTPLEAARRAAGLSRKQLAEKANVSIATIQSYEQRKRKLNVKQIINLASIADALGVPIQKILMSSEDGEDA